MTPSQHAQHIRYVIIDDGQYRYPVLRTSLRPDDSEDTLQQMTADEYADWCGEVSADTSHGEVGSEGCIRWCQRLIDRGAEHWHLS